MTLSISVAQSVVNTSAQGGTQTNAKTVALANGGFVVIWEDMLPATRPILLQFYDALGNATSGPLSSGLSGKLHDAILTGNGRIAIANSIPGTQTLNIRYLDATTGAVTATTTQTLAPGAGDLNGVQILAGAGILIDVMASTTNTSTPSAIYVAEATTAGGGLTGWGPLAPNGVGTPILDLIRGEAGFAFGMHEFGIYSAAGSSIGVPFIDATALVKINAGFYVMAYSTPGSAVGNVPVLVAFNGSGNNVGTYLFDNGVVPTTIPGTASGLSATTQTQLVSLGDGRILVVWGSFAGAVGTATAVSGLYAVVFNMNTNTAEDAPTLLRTTTGVTSANFTIQTTVLADGRIAVAHSSNATLPTGLTGYDVFRVVLDTRVHGIEVAAAALTADTYVGTSYDDRFTAVLGNDTIFGGSGGDTVVLAGAFAQVDLTDPEGFGGLGPTLTSIENLVGTAGVDTLFGSAVANNLDGGGANDLLKGRAGADTLTGGTGDDTLIGGDGNDLLDGGVSNDLMMGNVGDDTLYGGTYNDRMQGNDGDDQMLGGDANDVMDGGAGDDTLFGGAGDDALTGGDGADLVDAGDGNDLIHTAEGDTILGGAGTDTISYNRFGGQNSVPVGVYVDLDGALDPLADTFKLGTPVDVISGIENATGSGQTDFLAGSAAANRLIGRDGDDALYGRGGNDTLIGGAGADSFVFDGSSGGSDIIRDFAVGTDKVMLLLASFGDIGPDTIAARFVASATAAPSASAAAQFLFDNSGGGAGRLLYDVDGNGAGVATLIATLTFTDPTGLALFGANDFVFV